MAKRCQRGREKRVPGTASEAKGTKKNGPESAGGIVWTQQMRNQQI